MKPTRRLLRFLARLPFQPLAVHRAVDSQKRLPQSFDPDFPLIMRLYSFPEYRRMLGANWLNWHEHLEMIFSITGPGRFRSGEKVIDFAPGDLLIVDNLKLHGMMELTSEHSALVIFFMPELVYSTGSRPCDAAFLAPFWRRSDAALPILRSTDAWAAPVHEALLRLVSVYFSSNPVEDRQAACKLHFLEALYFLRRHFELNGVVHAGYEQQRQRVQRLKRLFDFLNANYAQKILLGEAAAMVAMSETRFKGFFKETTGTTFAQYVIHLRLAKAAELLREGGMSVAEIACATGFCDQSHFDNRFKEHFAIRPKEYRARHQPNGSATRPAAGLSKEMARSFKTPAGALV